jgi:hypothetical protein
MLAGKNIECDQREGQPDIGFAPRKFLDNLSLSNQVLREAL